MRINDGNRHEKEFEQRIRALGIRIERCAIRLCLKNGMRYLPDFFLPDLNTYVEVVGTATAYDRGRKIYTALLKRHHVNILFISYDLKNHFPKVLQRMVYSGVCSVSKCARKTLLKQDEKPDRLCTYHENQRNKFGTPEPFDGAWFGRRLKDRWQCRYNGCKKLATMGSYCEKHLEV